MGMGRAAVGVPSELNVATRLFNWKYFVPAYLTLYTLGKRRNRVLNYSG